MFLLCRALQELRQLQQQLQQQQQEDAPGDLVSVYVHPTNLREWILLLHAPRDSLYAGDALRLRVSFPADYPISPPTVYFLQPVPIHPHVYSNGDICLDLLREAWHPSLSVKQLGLAVLSVLLSARHKTKPQDDLLRGLTDFQLCTRSSQTPRSPRARRTLSSFTMTTTYKPCMQQQQQQHLQQQQQQEG
ncbi:hypothetical protein Efla_005576 [Eimeria flavescens]